MEPEAPANVCPHCGSVHEPDADRCPSCGRPLLDSASTQPVDTPRGNTASLGDEVTATYQPAVSNGSRLPLLLGGLAAILLSLLAGAFFVTNALGRDPEIDTARAMPPDSLGYVGITLDTDPQLLYAGARASMKLANTSGPEWFASWISRAKQDGVDIEADILPWTGRSMGVDITGIHKTSNGGLARPSDVLFALSVKDERAARAGLRKVLQARARATSDTQREEESYKGTAVLSLRDGTSVAVTNRVALIATSPEDVRDGIDRLQGTLPSLAGSEGYKRVLKNLPARRTAWFFVDAEPWTKVLQDNRALDALQVGGLPASALVGASLSSMQGGQRLDFYSYTPGRQSPPPAGNGGPAGERLAAVAPANAYLLYSAENLSGWWHQTRSRLSDRSGDRSAAINAGDVLKAVEESSGLDLDHDVFGPYTREYGVVIIPTASRQSRAGSFAVLLETKDPATARASLEKLSGALSEDGPPFSRREIAGKEAFVAEDSPSAEAQPGYLLGEGYAALALSPSALEQVADDDSRLAGSPGFKDAVSRLDRRGSTMVYVNVQSALDAVYRDRPMDRPKLQDNPAGFYVSRLSTVLIGADSGRDENRGSLLLYNRSKDGK